MNEYDNDDLEGFAGVVNDWSWRIVRAVLIVAAWLVLVVTLAIITPEWTQYKLIAACDSAKGNVRQQHVQIKSVKEDLAWLREWRFNTRFYNNDEKIAKDLRLLQKEQVELKRLQQAERKACVFAASHGVEIRIDETYPDGSYVYAPEGFRSTSYWRAIPGIDPILDLPQTIRFYLFVHQANAEGYKLKID